MLLWLLFRSLFIFLFGWRVEVLRVADVLAELDLAVCSLLLPVRRFISPASVGECSDSFGLFRGSP